MNHPNQIATARKETKRTVWKSQIGPFAVERRRCPRYKIEFPLTYGSLEGKNPYRWGLATDGGEGGVLVYLNERIRVGAILRIEIFYAGKLLVNKIDATAKVVWSDLGPKLGLGGHRHGLEFQRVEESDLSRLRTLLGKCPLIVNITGTGLHNLHCEVEPGVSESRKENTQ